MATAPSAWRPLVVVFVVAAVLRFVVAVQVWELPIVRTPKLDSFEYVSWARRLAAGDFAWPVISLHGPGYPFFLAAWLAIGSGSLHVALIAQTVVGALTAAAIAATAREWFGARAGLFAGILYAVYGPAVYIDTALLSEGLLVCFLALSLWALAGIPAVVRAKDGANFGAAGPGIGRAAAAGALLGGAILVRPTAALTLAAFGIGLLVSARKEPRRAATLAGAMLGACLLVASPVLVQNWSVSRNLSIQGYGGVNFYVGNSPLHEGRPTFRLGAGWDALNAEASRAGIVDPAEQDRYYLAKTLSEIRQHPAAFAKLLATKALWTVQSEEVRDSHSFYFFTDRVLLLRVLPRMAVLLPLACLGVAAMRSPRPALLAWYAMAASAGTVLLVVGTRYRMPLVPALVIAAGAGVASMVGSVTHRRTRELVAGAVAVGVGIVLSQLLSDPRNRNLSEEWAFTGSSLVTERNLTDAEAAYHRALELDPDSGFAADGLGLVYYDAGRLADARQSLTRAIARDPDSARAAFHLGLVDEREGRLPEAIGGYRRALDLSPYDAEITHRLATVLGMTGQIQDARTHMRRVVELTPTNGEAWLDLCLLALDLHDVAEASTALQRAREGGAGVDRLAFAADALARAK